MKCPRTVRNFWIHARVDGRESRVCGGPRAKDGGLSLTLYQRSDGNVVAALQVNCFALSDGSLRLEVEPLLPLTLPNTKELVIETKR
jgi:hypothetical protein